MTDAEILERAVRAARSPTLPRGFRHARWVAVRDAFCVGSTTATELCRRFGLDPDEVVRR